MTAHPDPKGFICIANVSFVPKYPIAIPDYQTEWRLGPAMNFIIQMIATSTQDSDSFRTAAEVFKNFDY